MKTQQPIRIGGTGFNDGVKFAQDLSFMTEEDWKEWNRAYAERLARIAGNTRNAHAQEGANHAQ